MKYLKMFFLTTVQGRWYFLKEVIFCYVKIALIFYSEQFLLQIIIFIVFKPKEKF